MESLTDRAGYLLRSAKGHSYESVEISLVFHQTAFLSTAPSLPGFRSCLRSALCERKSGNGPCLRFQMSVADEEHIVSALEAASHDVHLILKCHSQTLPLRSGVCGTKVYIHAV